MTRIVIEVKTSDIIGVKEDIAMYLEKHGDVAIVSVEDLSEQMKIGG